MTTTICKFCGSKNVEWKQALDGAWVMLDTDGYRHH